MFCLETLISDKAYLMLFKAGDYGGSMNWMGDNIRAVTVSHLLLTLDPTAELQQDKEIKLVHIQYIHCCFVFFPHKWNTYIWMLHVNVHFWNKWCGKASQHSQLRDRGVNKLRKNKKGGAKQHRAKAGPSTCVIIFTDFLHLGLWRAADQPHLLHAFSLSSSPSFSRLVVTSTNACLVSQKDGDLWECFGKNKCWEG